MTNAIYAAALKLINATGSGQAYQLLSTQEIVIGREAGCQILLDSQQHSGVSRRHAVIRAVPASQAFEVCDLNSGNGTFVNGARIASCQMLRAGDRISLGQGVTFTFEPVASGAAEQPDSALTLSNVFPLIGTRKDLLRKAYLIPGLVTVILVAILFSAIGSDNPLLYLSALGVYLAFAAYYFVYQLCGKRKPIWEIIAAGVIEMVLLSPPVFFVGAYIFRVILPGDIDRDPSAGLIQTFIGHFFGAGLLEELYKAIPIFLLMGLGRLKSTARSGVREPLDGILLGTAAAVAFTLFETLSQYVPNSILNAASQGGVGAGLFVGMQLLIPRVLGSIAGHMAYSGYFGYFIGLAALKPSKSWQLLSIGYFSSALLHALWNTFAANDIFAVIIGGLSYAFLVAVILQARKLSPNRSDNFATRFHP